jgi:glycine cleavage system H protein
MNKKTYLDEKFWVEKQGNLSKIGLTKGALQQFDHIDWIELPKIGKILEKGSTAVVVESSKAAIDIEAPLSGTVREVNTALESSPRLLEEAPEETWLYVVEE